MQTQPDLVRRPDKELAFFALAVGVLRGVKSTAWIGHFTDNVVENLFGDGPEERVTRDLPGMEVDAGELGVVVQHLLKVGCVWLPADGVLDAQACELVSTFRAVSPAVLPCSHTAARSGTSPARRR